ncbi:hypothetical protein [Sphingomonas sp. 35-24ZXX]|uniref:hypothetical protein n=1 Tax=Sphingomonas sp. 35-24ZXX TaxID=1545915 RepID=UPI00053C0279|nr:hypothetical protein [Sphingomonas sp. 35-24ZXX]
MDVRIGLIVAGLVFAVATPCHAAGVTAGSLIESTATASYDSAGGRGSVSSNRVALRVDEVIDATLTLLDSGPVGLAGDKAVLAFSVVNTGNGSEAMRLSTRPVAGSDFDPVVKAIAIDSNGNGVFDEGVDLLIQPGAATPEIAPDTSLRVFVIAGASGSPADGQQGRVTLLAEAVTGTGTPGTALAGQGSAGVDAIIGSSGGRAQAIGSLVIQSATVSIVKSATISDPFGGNEPVPGAFVTMTLNTQVTGSGAVSNLVVTSPVPAGTRYVASTLTLDGASLSDIADTDGGSVNKDFVEVRLGNLAGGTSRSIAFRLQIQ